MYAKDAMRTHISTANIHENVQDVIERMRESHHRMLPVVDQDGVVQGELSTTSIIHHIIPDYILHGDLKDVSYAPDISFLQKHYNESMKQKVIDVMDAKPHAVHQNKSLLCVASELLRVSTHGYLLVVDDNHVLLGIISTGDILNALSSTLEK
ncbi:MAG: CBS domain-containing protein [Mariprofundaceae bacterium]|nr:CBS domain-containing protein [Mariprofundaceae bacterium]